MNRSHAAAYPSASAARAARRVLTAPWSRRPEGGAPAALRLAALPLAAVIALATAVGPNALAGQDRQPFPETYTLEELFPPGQRFDPGIPSPQAFLGYEMGSHHTRVDRIAAYLEELARLSDRAEYQEIGRTIEHRPMPVLTITAPANLSRLERIRTAHLAASGWPDTEGPGDSAATPVGGDLPVIVHLGYGVHGNETSSSEAALLTAYWLVASETSEVDRFLQEGVYFVEAVLNPDGRDRHTHWANMHKAEPLVADPLDREHNEVWPGGRTNHYWFDLNRDWLPLVHPESRARIDFHHRWRPHVVTDYHEMGTGSTYFFEPSKPFGSWNPLLPEELYTDVTLRFADHWARALDEVGSLYFTKEVYDNTYPGYGSTYPNFLGGLGLVFEQASARGHLQESPHHGVLPFAFAIRNQLRTSLATVRAAVEHREYLQDYQRRFFTSGLAEAAALPIQGWVFGDSADAGLNRAFLDLLLRHRLEVHALEGTRDVGGHTFREGAAWVVPARQPGYRLARSIFERTSEFADSAFYDASTWTMSLAYGIPDGELTGAGLPLGARVTAVPEPEGLGRVPSSRYAYLLDWTDTFAPKALQHLQRHGVHTEVAFEPFSAQTQGGARSFGRGTISVPVQVQDMSADALHRLVLEAEELSGVPFHATATGYSVEGIDLGSRSFRPLTPPRVLLVVGDGASANEAGQVWHLLDNRVGMPITKIDRRDLPRARLSRYDVLVLVSGAQAGFQGEALDELKRWVREGGTLVALRTAARWAVENGFTAHASRESDAPPTDRPADGDTAPRRDFADAEAIRGAAQIGGSIYEVDVDTTHPVAFGYRRRSLPVWRDHSLFLAPSTNPYSTVARYTASPLLSGYVSAANLERIAGSASVLADRSGRGSVILFLDNPNFRGFWYGTNRLFLNALFFGRHVEVPAVP